MARVLERAHLTVTGLAVVCVVVVGWLVARALSARTMYLMVYAAVLAMAMAGFVARRRLAIDVDRSDLPMRVRVGQLVTVDLRLDARRRVSTIMIEERLPSQLGPVVQIPVGLLRPGDELVHRYSFAPAIRGVFSVGPLTATWSDPFGLTTQSQVLAEPVEVIVHPPVEAARDRVLTRMWEDPPVRPPVSKPWPVGFEFYGMRDYVPGDDLRRVVWNALARTGRLMVRESEQGITDRVVIVLDNHAEFHSPGERSDTFEGAVRAAAAVGVRHLEDGFSVSLLTQEGFLVKELRGARAHLQYLDALARVELSDKPLLAAAQTTLDLARARPHVLVLTPHLDAPTAQQLKLVVDRGVSVVLAKVLWEESDPVSLARAAALGCRIVQLPPGASLAAVFENHVGAGGRR